MDNKNQLMLIDANALIHRAFHGLPPLTTKDGTLVNAVYGFTATVFKAIEDFKPKYIAAAFDVKGPTIRHQEFKEYKATRPPAPEELIRQFTFVKEICKVLNIPVFALKGYEADDLIGTITKKVSTLNSSVSTLIVTGDMDTLQLVDENTEVYAMSRGIKQAEIYNQEKVREKYGFEPKYLVDYKALRGDPSDNIPGVPGIGEKTAKQLIQIFGSIENLYKQIINPKSEIRKKCKIQNAKFKISDKLMELLIKYKAQAFLSKKLATLITDVPIEFNLSDCKVHEYNKKEAKRVFKKLEFKSLIKRLPKEESMHHQEKLF